MRESGQALTSLSNPRATLENREFARREQPGNLAIGRATLINPGPKTVRRQFHNLPVELTPPPESNIQDIIASEYSY